MSNAIIQQGRFTADGNPEIIKLRSDIDWMRVYNLTTTTAGGAGTGVEFLWLRGMADDTGIEYQKLAADDSTTAVVMATGGFTRLDSSSQTPGALNATVTAIDNATPPGVLATSTATLGENDVIRFINVTGAQQFGGIDFTIDTVIANTSFNLSFGPTIIAGTAGSFRKIPFDPIYYPRRRYISAITQAANAVVTMTVTHGYTVGQKIRFQIPAA